MIRGVSSKFANLNNYFGAKSRWQSQAVKYLSTRNQLKYVEDITFPQEKGFVQSSLYGNNLLIPHCTIDEYIWSDIEKWQDKTAIVCGLTGRKYTYAKLRDHCAAFAIRLQQNFQLKTNDTLAICLPNIPEFPIATLGAIEAGLIVTPVNPIYTADEIARQLIDSDAKILIGIPAIYSVLQEAVKLTQRNIPIICIKTHNQEALPETCLDFNELINVQGVDFSSIVRPNMNPEDVIFLPYSSGTTGMPKGVQLTHTNLVANCEMLKTNTGHGTITLPTTDTYQDVLPCVLPFFHIYGFTVTLTSKLQLGCKIVTLPSFKPDTFLNSLAEHQGTVLNLVPPIIIFLANHEGVNSKHTDAIRNVFSGAAPIGAMDAERFTKRAPNVEFVQGYGLTETSPVVLMGQLGNRNYASIGSTCPKTQAKIVAIDDATNTGLGPNQTGELLVRGPQVMKGYHNNQKATDEMLLEGGWLRTGDIAHYDDDLQFYITDRLKELIKVKGFQVAPAELEEILRAHPSVADAAVVGTSHPISGEVPRAFIVPKKNMKINEESIKDFVAEKVAVYKKLEGGVIVVDSIPKNASGKILRRQLKEEYCS